MRLISPLKLISKILIIIVTVILVLYLTIIYTNFFPRGEDIVMYLPKNYDKNYIIIFYDQKDGVSKERIDGKRLFKIPNSGIFYTQYNMQREWVKYKYYYIDDDGTVLKQIKHRYDVEKLDSNEVYVMDGFASFKETDGYESQHEIIGKPNIIGENNTLLPLTKTRNIIDSIVKSKGCLKKKN